ncbi:MAG: DUF2752 domain-containing protein [Sphingobacteriaceae bacterium]
MLSLLTANPVAPAHFELCPLKLMGIIWCPRCGIGHAISFILHGRISKSFEQHWLGVPAVLIIFHRIYILIYGRIYKFKFDS